MLFFTCVLSNFLRQNFSSLNSYPILNSHKITLVNVFLLFMLTFNMAIKVLCLLFYCILNHVLLYFLVEIFKTFAKEAKFTE